MLLSIPTNPPPNRSQPRTSAFDAVEPADGATVVGNCARARAEGAGSTSGLPCKASEHCHRARCDPEQAELEIENNDDLMESMIRSLVADRNAG